MMKMGLTFLGQHFVQVLETSELLVELIGQEGVMGPLDTSARLVIIGCH